MKISNTTDKEQLRNSSIVFACMFGGLFGGIVLIFFNPYLFFTGIGIMGIGFIYLRLMENEDPDRSFPNGYEFFRDEI